MTLILGIYFLRDPVVLRDVLIFLENEIIVRSKNNKMQKSEYKKLIFFVDVFNLSKCIDLQ